MPEYFVFQRSAPVSALGSTRQRISKSDRQSVLMASSAAGEASLEDQGVFRWYRDFAKQKSDPQAGRQGRPHAFGGVLLDLTSAHAQSFRRKFPGVAVIRNARVRHLPAARVLGTQTNSAAPPDVWHLDRIGILPLRLRKGRGATVAVADTGVRTDHSEFDSLPQSIDSFGFDPDNGDSVSPGPDTRGHGTHVAGLVCGKTCGVAPEAKLINISLFSGKAPNLKAVLAALAFAAQHPEIDVVNLSIGVNDPDNAFAAVLQKLLDVGVLAVCAVGNSGAGKAESPADKGAALSAGFINKLGSVDPHSGSKVISVGASVPDLVAPGTQIFSARAAGGFEQRSGSSMAAAIVSGLAATLVQREPSISPLTLKSSLLSSVIPVGGDPNRSGNGEVVFV